ncbi:antitoxin of toxin-antitoxin stability system [Kumtagia ephedrae]|jgi:predicted transcriptional regulator|uniref:Antitoxin of toxin-antitoxin stability system n=1 Tax=Kumtagia ephedrae TaxID=2116701 RepID=A0A2P7S9G3_9HYPH|nr:antitoxin of toxin-antitoxin stability system [Mesorhizobium ephedrae]PSJ59129.1 antitoxin of toxin-antitoxin stability system [Mesorhizobium ephedrae]
MAKEAVFTMKLESELRDAFMAAAKRDDRPASQLVREFMRDYVQQDREYVEFLRRKVERSRASIAAGKWRSGEEVEADFRRRRQEILRNANEGDA